MPASNPTVAPNTPKMNASASTDLKYLTAGRSERTKQRQLTTSLRHQDGEGVHNQEAAHDQ